MKLKSTLGCSIFLCIIVVCVILGGPVLQFVRLPGILFTLGTTGALVLMQHQKGDPTYTVYANTKRYAIVCGIIGTFIGIIQMGRNGITDPARFMPGLGVALLTTLYGLIIYCIADAFDVRPKTT